MTHGEYLRLLTARAKNGAIRQRELKEIAQSISEARAGQNLYRLLYVVARAGGPAYESLVANYLIHPEDPEVSALAVQVLTGHWGLGAEYRKQILELLGSPEWDLSDDAFAAAVTGRGDPARRVRRRTAHTLLKVAEEVRGEYNTISCSVSRWR